MSLEAIDAVDWSAIPNPTGHQGDDPQRVAHALRLLTVSTTANETGDAASLLANGGFICDHAGMVFPAAYAATPALLALVEHGRRPRVKDAALGLLSDALNSFPAAGRNRVDTTYGNDVPLCCAIARRIRGRHAVLAAHGRRGERLLADAEPHWRLTVEETEFQADGDLTAVGFLEGSPFPAPVEAEPHNPPFAGPGPTVRIETLTADASGAVCVQLGRAPAGIVRGAVLYPAECGLREH
ncbi:hypothetical protein [Streptomyces niveiscabiei]|uniref:Uncharacterized protein n=1 Tax=Streptomyces niveiscabiei TaxID=164115 RepID=A0ABW9I3N0_9ACTN